MIFLFWFVLLTTIIWSDRDRSPVPIPGVCTMMTWPRSLTDQKYMEDYFRSPGAHEGEGCHTTASVAGADHFTATLLRQLAKSGKPPPEDLGPKHQGSYNQKHQSAEAQLSTGMPPYDDTWICMVPWTHDDVPGLSSRPTTFIAAGDTPSNHLCQSPAG